jgi:hypothetical protein
MCRCNMEGNMPADAAFGKDDRPTLISVRHSHVFFRMFYTKAWATA